VLSRPYKKNDKLTSSNTSGIFMASILQRGKKKRWYAMYRDLNGKQHCEGLSKELGARDQRGAQEEANLREDIANRRKDPQILRRSIDQLFEKYTSSAPTIREYLERWLETQTALGGAESSIANRQTAIDKLLDYLDTPTDHPMWASFNSDAKIIYLQPQHIQGFVSYFAALKSPGTVNNYISFIKQAFRDAKVVDKVITDNPAEYVKSVRSDRDDGSLHRRPFSVSEIRTILKAAPDQEWYSMILFGAYIGQRLSDIANLKWGNIDLEKGMIHLVTIKTGTHVDVYIAPPLLQYISTLKVGRPEEPIHPNAFPHARNTKDLSFQFVNLLKQIGLRKDDPSKQVKGRRQTSEISFHSLRHSVVSMLKEAGIADAAIEEYVGQSAEIQRQYTHVGQDALRKAAEAFPRL
jgi:integrase